MQEEIIKEKLDEANISMTNINKKFKFIYVVSIIFTLLLIGVLVFGVNSSIQQKKFLASINTEWLKGGSPLAKAIMEELGATEDDIDNLPTEVISLDLTGKDLEDINGIETFYRLETLILDDNKITALSDKTQEFLINNKNLETFSIKNNNLIQVDKDLLERFPQAFKYNLLPTEYQYEVVIPHDLTYNDMIYHIENPQLLRGTFGLLELNKVDEEDTVPRTKDLPYNINPLLKEVKSETTEEYGYFDIHFYTEIEQEVIEDQEQEQESDQEDILEDQESDQEQESDIDQEQESDVDQEEIQESDSEQEDIIEEIQDSNQEDISEDQESDLDQESDINQDEIQDSNQEDISEDISQDQEDIKD